MIILGIDPATSCGWALLRDGQRIESGVWNLKPRRHEGGGMRFLRVRKYIEEIIAHQGVDAVAYEEVRRHMGVDAAHIYGGIVAVITSVCEHWEIPYRGIPVGTVKKHATGKGNASKEQMVAAASERFGVLPKTDDEADALFIASALSDELERVEGEAR